MLTQTQLQQALQTATFELNYERSSRIVESVCKEEENRRLRLQLALVEDENEELHSQLELEQDRGDGLQHELDDAFARADELDAEVVTSANELRLKVRELESMRVRKSSSPVTVLADCDSRPNYYPSKTYRQTRRNYSRRSSRLHESYRS